MPDSDRINFRFRARAWDLLRGYEPTSFCDWPGRVTAVLFFGGCNLRCPTCHNASFAWDPSRFPTLDYEKVLRRIHENRKWLDGLVLTGGEVTLLPGFETWLSEISAMDLPLKLDTNGFRPEMVELALKWNQVQLVAVDIKGPWGRYPELTGGRAEPMEAEKSMGAVMELAGSCPDRFLFRCTRVPGLTEQDMREVRTYLPPDFHLRVQKYVPPRVAGNPE